MQRIAYRHAFSATATPHSVKSSAWAKILIGALLFVSSKTLLAGALYGCPVFHCTVEATGLMHQRVVSQVPTLVSNSALGVFRGQGCSGDIDGLFCLINAEGAATSAAGTLKSLNTSTLTPLWGTATAANSFNLDPASAGIGQVPYILANGNVAAGDATVHVLYNRNGAMLGKTPLAGRGRNFGMTPLSDRYSVVSQTDGVLTLVDTEQWQAISALQLLDPGTNDPLMLVSPSSASGDVLYVVAANATRTKGFLFSIVLDQATPSLRIRSSFTFVGRSGASPVVVTPSITGMSDNLVLLHVPRLLTDKKSNNRLLGITDNGQQLSSTWSIGLPSAMEVAPTIDPISRSLFYVLANDPQVYQNDLATGLSTKAFNLQSIGAFPGTFKLNGHLVASQLEDNFTVFLSASVSNTQADNGQYVMAFKPTTAAAEIIWSKKISSTADAYTAAWSLVPSTTPDVFCPVVVGSTSGVSRLCDF
jgi:hypothetical protein